MVDHNVSSIPVEVHHQIHMVGLMDILVHTVETFDALGPVPKANEFKAKFDISTEQLIGARPSFYLDLFRVTGFWKLCSAAWMRERKNYVYLS